MAASAALVAPSMFAVLGEVDSAGGAWSQVQRKAKKARTKQPLTGRPAAQPFDYYAVVDFECTCERGDSCWLHEIIEVPVVFVNATSRRAEFGQLEATR